MNSKESAEKSKKTQGLRLPSEGNILWEMYYKLPRMEQRALKEALAAFGAHFNTFLRDTVQGRALDLIPFGRLDFYTSFFVEKGFDNLFDTARIERTTVANREVQ
jgi:hypothetical protein